MTDTIVIVSPAQGPRGPQGDVGDTGPAGPRGYTGDQGTTGPAGAGYAATSTSSNAIASSGSKTFNIGAGLAYAVGTRLRATSTGSSAWMEGVVTSYDNTNVIMTMDLSSGSGTHTDWNISLTGNPGITTVTGAGTLGTQNANSAAITGGTISGVAISSSSVTGLSAPSSSSDAATKGYIDGRNINVSGLVTGGGNLSADRTITVTASSQAQAQAGIDTTTAMTPLAVAQAIAVLGGGVPSSTVVFTIKSSAPSGWLMFNDGTLGDASSGADHANADSVNVFTDLFNNVSDANCQILTSAGIVTNRAAQSNAATAFAAHCRMMLPKALGRALAVGGSGAGLTTRTLGTMLGEEQHALSPTENGPHSHALPSGEWGDISVMGGTTYYAPQSNGTPWSTSSASSGSGTPHNNMQPTVFLNAMIKL